MSTQKLNKKINNLTKARSVEELAKRVQKILRVMAYHVSQSESVVLDHHEDWREQFKRVLRKDVGKPP